MTFREVFRSDEGPFDAAFVRLAEDPSAGLAVMLFGLLVAVGVGAVHALGPGHGKALIGAYLAGSRGRARDAVALGVLVAAMHTGSVLVLGSVLHTAQRTPGSDRWEAMLTVGASLAVAAVGAWMLVRRLRTRSSPSHPHHHDHEVPDGVAPLSRAGVFALASTGGLLPSPAAFLVLLSALAVGRAAYGVALVAAFSVGLAATLTAIGLTVLWGRDALVRTASRRSGLAWVSRTLPIVAATAVMVGGLVLAGGAISRL